MLINVKITRKENAQYFKVEIGTIVQVEFEEYVAAVVASEIGNSNYNACCAQAVAARTYAMRAGVLKGKAISDDSSVAQAYRAPRYTMLIYPNCIKAANDTAGQILLYKNSIANTVYSACNGGQTVSCEERWGTNVPYLIAQTDLWDSLSGKKKNGHGVGMSQEGAIWAGNHNNSYQDILAFYYPGTTLCKNYNIKEEKIKIPKETLYELYKKIEKIKEEL